MLKTTILLERLISKQLKICNNKINGFSIISNKKIAKKSEKLKSQNLFKFQKLAKFKKLSKSGNLPNFDNIKTKPGFLIFDTKEVFNSLWLTLTKASIL